MGFLTPAVGKAQKQFHLLVTSSKTQYHSDLVLCSIEKIVSLFDLSSVTLRVSQCQSLVSSCLGQSASKSQYKIQSTFSILPFVCSTLSPCNCCDIQDQCKSRCTWTAPLKMYCVQSFYIVFGKCWH